MDRPCDCAGCRSLRRPFTLFHSRLNGKAFLECVIHGAQTGTLSQADAEARHSKEQCPCCVANIAATGDRSKAVERSA
jgi:hypothetical protein